MGDTAGDERAGAATHSCLFNLGIYGIPEAARLAGRKPARWG